MNNFKTEKFQNLCDEPMNDVFCYFEWTYKSALKQELWTIDLFHVKHCNANFKHVIKIVLEPFKNLPTIFKYTI